MTKRKVRFRFLDKVDEDEPLDYSDEDTPIRPQLRYAWPRSGHELGYDDLLLNPELMKAIYQKRNHISELELELLPDAILGKNVLCMVQRKNLTTPLVLSVLHSLKNTVVICTSNELAKTVTKELKFYSQYLSKEQRKVYNVKVTTSETRHLKAADRRLRAVERIVIYVDSASEFDRMSGSLLPIIKGKVVQLMIFSSVYVDTSKFREHLGPEDTYYSIDYRVLQQHCMQSTDPEKPPCNAPETRLREFWQESKILPETTPQERAEGAWQEWMKNVFGRHIYVDIAQSVLRAKFSSDKPPESIPIKLEVNRGEREVIVDTQKLGQGTYGYVLGLTTKDGVELPFCIKVEEDDTVCGEEKVFMHLHAECDVLPVRCLFSEEIEISKRKRIQRTISLMPRMEGKLRDAYKKMEDDNHTTKEDKAAWLTRVLEQIKLQLACYAKNGKPYYDVNGGNLMYYMDGDEQHAMLVDLGSMIEDHNRRLPATYPSPNQKHYAGFHKPCKDDCEGMILWACYVAKCLIILGDDVDVLEGIQYDNNPTFDDYERLHEEVQKADPTDSYDEILVEFLRRRDTTKRRQKPPPKKSATSMTASSPKRAKSTRRSGTPTHATYNVNSAKDVMAYGELRLREIEQNPDLLTNFKDYFVSEKKDGWQAIWTGEKLVSKSGKIEFPLPETWRRVLPEGSQPIAGELIIKGKPPMEVAKLKKDDAEEWKHALFYAFDLPGSTEKFETRTKELKRIVEARCKKYKECPLIYIKQTKMATPGKIMAAFNAIIEDGGEGIVLTHPESKYTTGKRRKEDRAKLKHRQDTEGTVVGLNYNANGTLKSLRVETAQGNKVNIGTGFSDTQRRICGREGVAEECPEIGDVVTFSFLQKTKNSFREPRFVRVRDKADM